MYLCLVLRPSFAYLRAVELRKNMHSCLLLLQEKSKAQALALDMSKVSTWMFSASGNIMGRKLKKRISQNKTSQSPSKHLGSFNECCGYRVSKRNKITSCLLVALGLVKSMRTA